MSEFLRKASLKIKKSENDLSSSSPKSNGIANGKPSIIKPPKSRSASTASSIVESENGDAEVRKRKDSVVKKSKKRLSSLFSSHSLSSLSSDKDRPSRSGTTSPLPRPSPLGQTGSSSSSSANGTRSDSTNLTVPTAGIGNLSLGSTERPLVATPPELTESRELGANKNGNIKRQTESLYSQWDQDDLAHAGEDSSDEDDGFYTPSEGLSQIGEEDEAELPKPSLLQSAGPSTQAKQSSPAPIKPDVKGGTKSEKVEDLFGTGPSTVRRTKPEMRTSVKPRAITKADALAINQAKILGADVDITREVLRLFLSSKMKESEDLCFEKDPDGNHLYLQNAYGIIQGLKGMMTFDDDDLKNALEICRNNHITATALRRPGEGLLAMVKPGAALQRVKAMSVLERHAELVYAESALMKAMLAIVAGGDWFGLVREALNMRSAHGIYRTLQQFMEDSDKHGYDEDIDMDFRSGVLLGTGTSSLMLSLLPGKVLKIAEVFGYAGDRTVALTTLMAAGGWESTKDDPIHTAQDEGLRRPVCDLILLAFHLVVSLLMPVSGVDIPMARKILDYNLKRYPDGIFLLYFAARLHTAQCEPEIAVKSLQRALDLELEYVQLQHMCLWDYALNYSILNNWKGALDCFAILREESNWSRAVYTYSTAACLVELVNDGSGSMDEAEKLMKEVPKLTKKMAGKSLPIEKLVARKTRKFESQGRRLFLPAMELAYVYGAIYHAPRRLLLRELIPRIDRYLSKLKQKTPETYGLGYWDDYCLGHFLRGVCGAVARYQPSEASESAFEMPKGKTSPSEAEMDKTAEQDLLDVIEHGPDVELDHYLIYHCHFELGKLYAQRGDKENAQRNFDVVMSGKPLKPNKHEQATKGKYSLEGALLLKTHSAIQALKEGRRPA